MTIQEMIEKAIEGGWKSDYELDVSQKPMCGDFVLNRKSIRQTPDECYSVEIGKENVLLDPTFWQTVGKVCGWEESNGIDQINEWHVRMSEMINALCEGRTLEEYVATL